MRIDLIIKKAHQILINEIIAFVVTFEKEERFNEYNLSLYDLTKESIQNLEKLPNIVEFANDIISTLELNHPEIWQYDYWQHLNLLEQQVEVLEPIAEKILNDENFKQEIIQNGFKKINKEFWENERRIKEKEKTIPIINLFAPGTLYHLENSLIFLKWVKIKINFVDICEECGIKLIFQENGRLERSDSIYWS